MKGLVYYTQACDHLIYGVRIQIHPAISEKPLSGTPAALVGHSAGSLPRTSPLMLSPLITNQASLIRRTPGLYSTFDLCSSNLSGLDTPCSRIHIQFSLYTFICRPEILAQRTRSAGTRNQSCRERTSLPVVRARQTNMQQCRPRVHVSRSIPPPINETTAETVG